MPPPSVLTTLRDARPPYFVMDAARTFGLPPFLQADGIRIQSLYDGESAIQLRDFAPYLVALEGATELTDRLLDEGWGRSWGIFLACPLPFDQVRRHLRRFLRVKVEDRQEMFFRFYDPRVLRVFLPTCTPAQLDEFFGPVQAFLMESESGSGCLVFRNPAA